MHSHPPYAIVVHGGAGKWSGQPEAEVLDGVRRAAAAGLARLADGEPALEAVIAAVCLLEDNPLFNAGTGAALNSEGEAELDAGVMVGEGLRSGNVAALRRVRNPVLVARRVMEATPHELLAGDGALRFARAQGFEDYDPVTPERRADRQRRLAAGDRDEDLPTATEPVTDTLTRGTVGAVALDTRGGFAAATSTGGLTLKLPGRVGDSPVPGAGNCAGSHGAASATGQGELMLRFGTTRAVCEMLAGGHQAQAAVATVLARMGSLFKGDVGLIAVDRLGRMGIAHNTPAMPHAFAGARLALQARMRG
jgi:beta-aspartyl-peptidase (threonine type)